MCKFSLYNLLKISAKTIAKELNIKHSEALELVAKKGKFSNFHGLSVIAEKDPMNSKLLMAVFGKEDLGSIIYCDHIYSRFEMIVEDNLSYEISMTNAFAFEVDNLNDPEWSYDAKLGKLLLNLSFEYNGEQDDDKVYSGSSFFVEAKMSLLWRDKEWEVLDNEFEIISCLSNVEDEYDFLN